MKRKGDRYSTNTSLIVASMKRLLPVGLSVCFPSDHSLIMLAKCGFTQVGWTMDSISMYAVHVITVL